MDIAYQLKEPNGESHSLSPLEVCSSMKYTVCVLSVIAPAPISMHIFWKLTIYYSYRAPREDIDRKNLQSRLKAH